MGAIRLRFHALPLEHRIIVTSNDVRAKTATYCVRSFGGGEYARKSEGTLPAALSATHLSPLWVFTRHSSTQIKTCFVPSPTNSSRQTLTWKT